MRREDIHVSMGRKRKPGPKRAPRKTGGIVKGSTHVMEHKREAIVQLRGMGHSGNKISCALSIPKSTSTCVFILRYYASPRKQVHFSIILSCYF